MNIQTSRSELLQALQAVIGVVERRQSLPILSNVLLSVQDDRLTVTATDLELQVDTHIEVQNHAPGRVTAPARKLHDLCRGLPEGANIELQVSENRLTLRSGRSRFALATLDADQFPSLEVPRYDASLTLANSALKRLLQKTQFAMAQQDVRYYLNGLLLECRAQRIRAVATDGHRLALAELEQDGLQGKESQLILPRKTVLELQRLLTSDEGQVTLRFAPGQLQVEADALRLTSKLIDGRFPDYERVIPERGERTARGDRRRVRAALSRAAILSNEKFRGVRLTFESGLLRIQTQNPEQEEAEEEVELNYDGEPLEIGFNVTYLLDALDAMTGDEFVAELRGPDASGVLMDPAAASDKFVVMPMRL
jgi:DNA polymerase-3 subunit beta